MDTSPIAPPDYVEVTDQVHTAIGECEQHLARIRMLRQADVDSAALMKQVAATTKPPHGQTKHYYRAGFGWRGERLYNLELEIHRLINDALPHGSIAFGPQGQEVTIVHCRIAPTWSEEADTLQAITWEGGSREPLRLNTQECEGLRFFAPTTPDEPTE